MKSFMVWDTETTGLPLHFEAPLGKQPSVIEFGAALLSTKDGSVLKRESILINPGKKLEPIITKITGITDNDLEGAPSFGEAWPRIRAMFENSSSSIAHNEPFDNSLIEFELRRIGVKDFAWPKRLCTIGMYRGEFGFDPKLTVLYEHVLKKKLDQTHRASDDVNALIEIIQAAEIWRIA